MDDTILSLRAEEEENRFTRILRWVFPIKSLALGAFGFATLGCVAALDADYASNIPFAKTVLIGSIVFTVSAFLSKMKHWKKLLLGYCVALPVMAGVVMGVLFSGVLTEKSQPLVEAVGVTGILKPTLEKAHSEGVIAENWADLHKAGLTDGPAGVDGKYYRAEDITWSPKFDDDGRFIGTVMFEGDTTRNIPSARGAISERGRPTAELDEFRAYLPILPRNEE